MFKKIIWVNGLLRGLSPLLIFYNPVIAEIATWVSDQSDGYFAYRAGWAWRKYHNFDKFFDLWWYIFILAYSTNLVIFPVILGLFIYRVVGQLLSVLTGNEKLFMLFPNILEFYFVAYLLTLLFEGFGSVFYGNQILILIFCLLFSLSQEYRIHIKKIYIANVLWKLNIDWTKNR